MNIENIDIDYQALEESDDKNLHKKQQLLTDIGVPSDLQRHLKKQGFGKLTQVQEQVLPTLMQEMDSIVIARTGSGKTLAYLIPLISKLMQHAGVAGVRGIILAPTRELAIQISTVLKHLVKYQQNPLRVCLVTGGDSLQEQFNALAQNPDIIVATPGRLQFHLEQIGSLRAQFKSVNYFVIDECDQMFEQQLQSQITELLNLTGKPQIVLVSATLPLSLKEFSGARLKNPQLLQNESQTFPNTLFVQSVLVGKEYKEAALLQILSEIYQISNTQDQRTLLFVATKYHCEYFVELFQLLKIKVQAIYGALDQSARNSILQKFKNNEFQVLIATDVAARGVDIPDLRFVINYNFPFNARSYLHRGGRCARNGQFGCYINVLEQSELSYLLDANLFIGSQLNFVDLENYFKYQKFLPADFLNKFRPRGEEFAKNSKQLLKQYINEEFEKDVNLTNKQNLEFIYKQGSNQLTHSNHQEYQNFQVVQTYIKNCQLLHLDKFLRQSFFNDATIKSQLNNQLGTIPQNVLDMQQQKLQVIEDRAQFIQARKSMINSLQQLNKQKKSASEASAAKAKELGLLLKTSKYYLINYFDQAQFQGVKSDELTKQLHMLENFRISDKQLKQKADSGAKEFEVTYKMRKIVNEKRQLMKFIQMKQQKLDNQMTGLQYNSRETIQQIDQQIQDQKEQVKLNAQQSQIISSVPILKSTPLEFEIAKDEFQNVKGQVEKKVWDPKRKRYVLEKNLVKEHTKKDKMIQNSKGEWVKVKVKSLYEKWSKQSNKKVGMAGAADETDIREASNILKLQGLNRKQKVIMKSKLKMNNTVTTKDKAQLEMQLNKDKTKKKKKTKPQIIQEKAREMYAKGVDYQKVKRQSRQDQQKSRTDYMKKSTTKKHGKK